MCFFFLSKFKLRAEWGVILNLIYSIDAMLLLFYIWILFKSFSRERKLYPTKKIYVGIPSIWMFSFNKMKYKKYFSLCITHIRTSLLVYVWIIIYHKSSYVVVYLKFYYTNCREYYVDIMYIKEKNTYDHHMYVYFYRCVY